MDNVSETRLAGVCPALASKIRQIAESLQPEGIYIRVVQALRTWQQQDALYRQGRSTPGNKVTNCPAGYSYHNFGLAVDCVPSDGPPDQAFAPDWSAADHRYLRMQEVARELGLTCGVDFANFPDPPHFQLQGRFPIGAPDDEVRQIFRAGGIEQVWKAAGLA